MDHRRTPRRNMHHNAASRNLVLPRTDLLRPEVADERSQGRGSRMRAYVQFLVAVLYFFLARSLARPERRDWFLTSWFRWSSRLLLAFLLLWATRHLASGSIGNFRPISAQGFPRAARLARRNWTGSGDRLGPRRGLRAATRARWRDCRLSLHARLSLGLARGRCRLSSPCTALAEEIAFRGYGFQRFAVAVGPIGASWALPPTTPSSKSLVPGSSRASFFVSVALGLLLSAAYLRTRALWLSWGINFGWKASRALLFGLAVTA